MARGAREGRGVYLLGAHEKVVALLARQLRDRHPGLRVGVAQRRVLGTLDQPQRQVMRILRFHAEQKRADQAIGHKGHRIIPVQANQE